MRLKNINSRMESMRRSDANDFRVAYATVFSRVNVTLEAAMSVGRSVGRSVTFLKLSLNLHFKGTLRYFRVL